MVESLLEKVPAAVDRDAEEDELIDGVIAGDAAHAERLVRTHIGWMRAVAFRLLRDEGLADDCVQEALLNAFQKIGAFERRSRLKTWLHRITVNQALMKLRAMKRLNEQPIDPLMPEFDENACRIEAPWPRLASTEEVVERESTRALVLSKIGELPDNYRIVLMLRDIEELETAEVAELLEISESNVKVRLHRARSALKKLLEPLLRGEVE